jgi:hypothetical protein
MVPCVHWGRCWVSSSVAEPHEGSGHLWKTEAVSSIHIEVYAEASMLAVHRWCATAEAHAVARRLLDRRRLTLSAEDLVFEAQERVLCAIDRNPDRFATFTPAAYCTTVMANLVKRLLSRRDLRDDVPLDVLEGQLSADPEPVMTPPDRGDLDRYCAAVEALGGNPVHVSGALTVTYLLAFDDIDVDDAPWPRAGVRDDRRHGWPALWFATRNPALFPNSSRRGDPQARIRQRHLDKIEGLRVRARLELRQGASS